MIQLKNVKVHNLKGFDLQIEPNQLVVLTGVSGSGKSSLAFDTIYVEGQRRYVESLSPYARRQIAEWTKPELDDANGITPTISIEQKSAGSNPRSTVGTITEVYDFMRVLWARVGTPYCPVSGEPVSAQSKEKIISSIQSVPDGEQIIILSPFAKEKKGEFKEEFLDLQRKGFLRVRIDGEILHLEDEISLDGNVAHNVDIVVDRLKATKENQTRIAEAVTQSLDFSQGLAILLLPKSGEETLYSMHAYSEKSGISYNSLEPQNFSFNSPSGMCSSCLGLGEIEDFDEDLVIDPEKSIAENCCRVASSYNTVKWGNIYRYLAERYNFSINTPWKKLSKKAKHVFLFGSEKKWLRVPFTHPETGSVWHDHIRWEGVFKEAKKRYAEAKSELYRKKMQSLMKKGTCTDCAGSRLQPYPAACLLGKKKIHDITHMTIDQALSFFEKLKLGPQEIKIADELLKEIQSRLKFLLNVGLHYLTIDRSSPTLSGGESQRVRLASQIGIGLVGITYVLDEPSIGLHQRDNHRLIKTLKHLRDMGNTVLVVEHDEETIDAADHIIDVGPGPGYLGGEIIVDGSLEDLYNSKKSITGAYLRGEKSIKIPKKRRKGKKLNLQIKGAKHHNLKNVDVSIPLKKFVAVTGVSGSGKSSLILETLFPALSNALHHADHYVGKHDSIKGMEHIDKVIAIDQSPIGKNPRSNPSTYIKLFDLIRNLFSELPEAKAKGFDPGQFSFNVKEGSCATCSGHGMIRIDMDFLEDNWVDCPTCEGMRFDPHTLSVSYKGKTIADILDMEISQAAEFFSAIPKIKHRLNVLEKVGLGYIKLGQPSPTLSGGEAQRVKLAKELLRPSTGNTLYLLDEPTTGLHFADIDKLLEVLHHFVDEGNTVLVIEHNLDLIKTADWIVDLGPEGGNQGGELVGEGTPEEIAKQDTPTGRSLKELLEKKPFKPSAKDKRDVVKPVQTIEVKGARQNSLKNVDTSIPREKITIACGPSGSGKSSFAYETVYAEGQRRYIESLSPYARQFVKQMPKPIVGSVEGLSPAIAIEQKAHAGNPRSTIGTMTEIYDYLRILWASMGTPHNPETGNPLKAISPQFVVDEVMSYPEGEKIQILAPIEVKRNQPFDLVLSRLKKEGFLRILLNEETYHLDDPDFSQIHFDRKRKNTLFVVIDRLKVKETNRSRIQESIRMAAKMGQKCLTIIKGEEKISYYLQFTDPKTGQSFPPITPKTFAFNHPHGFCPNCQGIGTQYGSQIFSENSIGSMSVYQLIELVFGTHLDAPLKKVVNVMLKAESIDGKAPINTLREYQQHLLTKGSSEETWYTLPDGGSYRWVGIDKVLAHYAKEGPKETKEILQPLMQIHTCQMCRGKRLNPLACHVTIDNYSLPDLCALSIEQMHIFMKKVTPKNRYLEDIHQTILHKLAFLEKIGLHYLSLDRKSPTLSGGETQRIRLARQLGSGLTGALYVLDEPTIGLHPKDANRLNSALIDLKTLGNTLLMVEHDPETLAIADKLIDFGPGAGHLGGKIIASGTLNEIKKDPNSLTGQYLSGKKSISIPEKRRSIKNGSLELFNARMHNIENLSVEFPLETFTCISGVSGSGKSTLMHHIFLPLLNMGLLNQDHVKTPFGELVGIDQIDKILHINQDPIGHTSRSDVGTYVDLLSKIRSVYAQMPEAQIRGLQPRHFSYNHPKGMCTTCWGLGYKKVEMLFLPPIRITCPACQGKRLNPLSLEVTFKDKHFGDILNMTVAEALHMFENHRPVNRILTTLSDVGLDYLHLGQQMATLSGGEAQRIKLSKELSKRATGNTLYILDEPTVGLHSVDVEKLLTVLHRLVDKGNTIIVIEHNTDVIKNADYVIDMGPEAGEKGGKVIATGTPEQIAKSKKSFTGQFLK